MAITIDEHVRVAAPRERVWTYFSDLPRVAPCLPGAQLTEAIDEKTYKGRVRVQVGPVVAQYQGTLTVEALDVEAGVMTMVARGTQVGAAGRAEGRITCTLHPVGEAETDVTVSGDLTITGRVAQLGAGLIGSVAKELFGQFARCAQQGIVAATAAAPGSSPDAAATLPETPAAADKPLNALDLGGKALLRALRRR